MTMPYPIGAVGVVRTQTQSYASGDKSIVMDIGFGANGTIARVVIERRCSRGSGDRGLVEVFCRPKQGDQWFSLCSPPETAFRRSAEEKVKSYLMERFNLDIAWNGSIQVLAD